MKFSYAFLGGLAAWTVGPILAGAEYPELPRKITAETAAEKRHAQSGEE